MNTDRWGAVIQPSSVSAASWNSMISQACGMQSYVNFFYGFDASFISVCYLDPLAAPVRLFLYPQAP